MKTEIKTKTEIEINIDNFGSLSYDYFIESTNELVNEIDLFCEVKNNKFSNIVEDEKRYDSNKEDYKNTFIVSAKGYSQSEWQEYTIYTNEDKDSNSMLILMEHLQRTFTHFNDYSVNKYDIKTIEGIEYKGESYDYTTFCIDYIEFPSNEDIKREYKEIYGKDYDSLYIDIY